MDSSVMDFFDFSKDFKRNEHPRGCVSGDPHALVTEQFESKPAKRETFGTEYVASLVEKEQKLMDSLEIKDGQVLKRKSETTLDDIDSDDDDEFLENCNQIRDDDLFYEKYHFDLNRNKTLPIYNQRQEIVEAIEKNPVVILKGETGCGKTTQVPQYILDEAFKRRKYCNIVVTQPRRIAAISIANRVAEERRWEVGKVVSYQVGLHRKKDEEDTRLLFCTTGVLLNTLIRNKSLGQYTHIVLDEVHERDQDMDFLLIVVRRLLALNSHHVKIILMSATIDAREFANYFITRGNFPPVINASHGRKYPLVKFYRDQLRGMQLHEDRRSDEACIPADTYAAAIKILMVIDNMERRAEEQTDISYEGALLTGSVLIFLPGVHEIETMAENIQNVVKENPALKVTVMRCHSLMSPDSQEEVFLPPPAGFRKIILATNIAESSITVPDISYVIDFCLTKVLVTDTATNFSCLRLVWASKSNCRQRAGRVGRLRNGRVYRLVTRAFYQRLPEFGIPEMLRSPLQGPVLKAKLLEMGSPKEILGLALSPPNESDISNTILLLKEVGALYPTVDGVYQSMDGDITYWGRLMSRLPLDVRLCRLILLGYVFNILEETIIMAAGMTLRSMYLQPERGRRYDQMWMHYIWADGSGSDLVSSWRLYNTYRNMCCNRGSGGSAKDWAYRFGVNLRSLKEMHLLVEDVKSRCTHYGLQPMHGEYQWDDREKAIVMKVVIAGAFYPNYFMRSSKSNMDTERQKYQVTGGLDPTRTVFFTNFEARYMGELYTRRIKEMFLQANIPPEHMDVTFQHGSEKIFVTFKRDDEAEGVAETNPNSFSVHGGIMVEVYKAMRMRLDKINRNLRVMEHFSAMKYVEQKKIGVVVDGHWVPPNKTVPIELYTLPSLFEKTIAGRITHIVSCGQFYFQPTRMAGNITSMTKMFNSPTLECEPVRNARAITKGLQLLALHDKKYQRARVVKVETYKSGVPKFRVRFIDFGNVAVLTIDQLRLMPPEMLRELEDLPPRVFECRLALVQPSTVSSCYNRWPQEANDMLSSLAKCGPIELEIYSLVNNIASVIMHMGRDGILNEKLVARNLARRADEDFMSRQDHDFRMRKQEGCRYTPVAEQHHMNEEYLRSAQHKIDADLEPPPMEKCSYPICLKGPFSPLETSMYSMLHVGLYKTVNIDRDSVNAILLDTDPQDQHDQMVVAASVSEKQNYQLTARGTTAMPNIHGFAALMTMLFCPTMQIKTNKERSKYVCILAGLGYDENTMEPYYEEHDIVVNLDVNILKDDITIINQLRYIFDTMFVTYSPEQRILLPNERNELFVTLRALLTKLLNKDRSFIEPHMSTMDYRWENQEDLEEPAQTYGKRCIFPSHCIQELRNESMETLVKLKRNCTELYNWRNFDGIMQPLECKLCNQQLENVVQLRLHLLTQRHRDRERQIGWHQDK